MKRTVLSRFMLLRIRFLALFFCSTLVLPFALAETPATASKPAPARTSCTDLEGKPEPCPVPRTTGSTTEAADRRRSVGADAKSFLGGVVADQRQIWSSPLRLGAGDAQWLVPVAGIGAGLMVTDRTTSRELTRGTHQSLSAHVSDAGLGAMAMTAGSMYLLGLHTGDNVQRETGLLSLQAGLDGLMVDEALKFAFRRERPDMDFGRGRFFQPNGSSFPSAHAATAFSMATVFAHEYPRPAMQILAYGAATAISMARVAGEKHYPSDVFIGGVMGYMIGRGVYRRHHDPTLEQYGTFEHEADGGSEGPASSTYLELDSWVYPAVERLTGMGVVDAAFLGLRPWTRMAVYKMIEDVQAEDLDEPAASLVAAVRQELQREKAVDEGAANQAISIDQIYARTQVISGTPLRDSYHFGETLPNDFGRPYAEGWQQVNGFETRAEHGRFSFFVRGEYQHIPEIPGYSAEVAQVIATQDGMPVALRPTQPARNVFRLLDTYASMKLLGHDISVGKQSYWWSPDSASAMMLSNNAEPIYSVRLNRTTPLWLPVLSKLLGPVRYDNFFGKLTGGHSYPAQPYFYGQKFSFQPTANLELGFSRNAVFSGQGMAPLTFGSLFHSLTSTRSGTYPGMLMRDSPGARHGAFDFRYRLPKLRNWLTLYADSLVHDDVSPISAPRRAAVTPGIYLSKVPGIPKLDLHVEGGTTDTVTSRALGGSFYYIENWYRDGYLNKNQLLGSWLGREGTGGQTWLTYWFNPNSFLRAGYRTVKVSQFFVPQGLSQQDAYVEWRHEWRSGLGAEILIQAERWYAPVLADQPQNNVTTQVQVSYRPKSWGLAK